jgi:hypothetical protein
MDLYVGNATTQHFDLQFRVPESNSVRRQPIPHGGQVKLTFPGGFNQGQVDSIVQQFGAYGAVGVDEVNARMSAFHGLVWSVDRPIKSDKIQQLMMHNTNQLVILGRTLRQNAALVENDHLGNQSRENGLGLRKTEISVQEEVEGGNVGIAEGYKLLHEGSVSGGRSARRRG